MMMRCLEAGGLNAVYSKDSNSTDYTYGVSDYDPNPNGFYIVNQEVFSRPDFTTEYDGRLLKCHYPRLIELPRHEYRCIFMLRNPDEILDSMFRFSYDSIFGVQALAACLYDTVIPAIRDILDSRPDIDVSYVNYSSVISNAVSVFESLALPINAVKAASVVDERLYRNRRG